VRYADDLLAFCHSREHAQQVKRQLAEWLRPRGLMFNEAKTQIVHVNQGCDFLGFNIRRYHGKLPLIKPSDDAVKRIRLRLRTEMRLLLGGNVASVMHTLTPIIRGWAAYYRVGVSSEVFSALDDYMWKLLYKWIKRTHPNKSRWWRMDRYFGRFNRSRNNRWVFGDKDTGAYLPKFAWTKIVRHVMVAGTASPDDPDLARYWADRRGRQHNGPLSVLLLAKLKTQRGRCPLLRNHAAARRPRTSVHARVGTMASRRPDGDEQTQHRRRTGRSTPHSHRLPNQDRPIGGTSATPCGLNANRTCLSRMNRNVPVRF
jgi:RNA-directed DNA polymerase